MPDSYTGILTEQGLSLTASLQAGERLAYTKIATSDGSIPDLFTATALPNERQALSLLAATYSGNMATLQVLLDCLTNTQEYAMRYIGIFARRERQADSEAILYKIIEHTPPVQIPAQSAMSITFSLNDSINNTDNITAIINSAAYTPSSHMIDKYRHIFVQTNRHTSALVADGGGLSGLDEGDCIVFVPTVNAVPGFTLDIGFGNVPCEVRNAQNIPIISGIFLGQSYVFRYENGTFVTTINENFQIIDGEIYYFNGFEWVSVRRPGSIDISGGTQIPPGWAACNGAAFDPLEYPRLFEVLGYTYGTASGGRFLIPDIRTRNIMMYSGTAYPLGYKAGSMAHRLTVGEMPSHKHPTIGSRMVKVTIPANTYASNDEGVGSRVVNVRAGEDYGIQFAGAKDYDVEIPDTEHLGGGQTHSIVQPTIAMNVLMWLGKSY